MNQVYDVPVYGFMNLHYMGIVESVMKGLDPRRGIFL
jgi:hypothetical protein